MPKHSSHACTGSASETAAAADARNPTSVMPTWIVASSRVGSSVSSSAVCAPLRALGGALLERRPARADERDLGRSEVAVERDQNDDECYLEGSASHVQLDYQSRAPENERLARNR